MEDVILLIRGQQTLPDQDPESFELRTEGLLTRKGDGTYTLSYQESEMTGMKGTRTIFQISPDYMTMQRVGTVNAYMMFRDGQRYQSMYSTPYGELEMNISTQRLRVRMEEDGGELEVVYTIEMNHMVTGRHQLSIQIQPAPASQESV